MFFFLSCHQTGGFAKFNLPCQTIVNAFQAFPKSMRYFTRRHSRGKPGHRGADEVLPQMSMPYGLISFPGRGIVRVPLAVRLYMLPPGRAASLW